MNTNLQINTAGLSTEKILLSVINEATNCFPSDNKAINHLDIGAGNGELIKLISSKLNTISSACDYTESLMEIKEQCVDVCDLNTQKLPYKDEAFDLITFTEVIEHIENHRFTLSEISRVLKPGGYLILSTPNILNLKSRVRFLFCGFWNLFGPLKIGDRKIESTGGHINPIHYFYIVHSLMESGLQIKSQTVDKNQTSSLLLAFIFFIPIKIFSLIYYRKEIIRRKTIDHTNSKYVYHTNSLLLLLGRTIIVTASKGNAEKL
jgi:ubiquinone/menaquinone biosynthesis C-methylase UbiE